MRPTERKPMLSKLRKFFTNEVVTPVDEEIEKVLKEMNDEGVTSDEYSKQLTYLERLYEIKAKERPKPLSRDTILIVGGNLVLALGIVIYETSHMSSSKGFNQFMRPRMPS